MLSAVLWTAFVVLLPGCGDTERKGASSSTIAESGKPAPSKPDPRANNLILITMDTTRADALGSYGQRLPVTPNIDRLALEGVLFEQVSSSNPETLPSHATIMTGKFPFSHGVRSNAGYSLSDQNETLAEHLKRHGYKTGAEIASVVLASTTQITQGFDHYRGVESPGVVLKKVAYKGRAGESVELPMRIGSDIANKGIEFIRKSRNEAFFLWLHFFDPHYPYAPRIDFRGKAPGSPYHGEVAWMDAEIGRVVAEVEKLGLGENTLIAVTADHGEGLGEHGEETHPYFVYDSTIRVPLIMSGIARLPADRRIGSHVRTVDIVPTLLALLELPDLEGIEGQSLTPLIHGMSRDLALTGYGESAEFMVTFGLPLLRFVRDGDWKYIHKVNPELYDLATDPDENKNLAAQHPEIVARLAARLDEMLGEAPAAPQDTGREVDAETLRQLSALGYAAQSPRASLRERMASTELSGADPRDKLEDIKRVTNASSLIESGEFAPARELLELVLAGDPGNIYVLGLLSDALAGEGNNRESLAVLEKVYAADPAARVYANNYAYLLATIDDEALRDGARALEIARDVTSMEGAPDANFFDTLAAAQAEGGDFEAATKSVDRAIELLRGDATQAPLRALLQAHRRSFERREPLREPAGVGRDDNER